MRELGCMSTRLLSVHVINFVSPCERRVQNQHMVTVSSAQLTAFAVLLLPLAVIKQRCISVGAPFWRIACIRRKASCTEPRGPYHDGSVRIHVFVNICIKNPSI